MLSLNHIAETFLDFPDGESLSVIAFFNGCSHACPGCQNPELQQVDLDSLMDVQEVYDIIVNRCLRNKTNKVVLSGGDPFFNPKETIKLISLLELEGYVVCVYTGYTIDKIKDFYKSYADESSVYPTYVKCGVYIENMRDNAMGKYDDKFILASTNQAFYKAIYEDNVGDFKQISDGHILYF